MTKERKKIRKREEEEQLYKTSHLDYSTLEKDELINRLSESERRSLGLFELTNDAIFIIGLEGNYIDVNQRAGDMLGYNPQDLREKSMFDFIVQEQHDQAKNRLQELLAGEILPIYRREFIRKDGSVFPAEINASIVQDEEGKPLYIQSAVRDITDRVKAERKLDNERKVFHIIAEATITSKNIYDLCDQILDGITTILDFDASILFLYDEENQMLLPIGRKDFCDGEPRFDPVPRSIHDAKFVYSLAARTKQVIMAPKFEHRKILEPYRKRLDEKNIKSLLVWPLVNAEEKLIGVMELVSKKEKLIEENKIVFETIESLLINAIERKKAEEALITSEQKHRSFLENFQGIAFGYDENQKPLFYHGDIAKITNFQAEDFLSAAPRWRDIIYSEDKEKVLAEYNRLFATPNEIINLEYRIQTKDEQIRWLKEISQNITDAQGRTIMIQGSVYDITERKRSELVQNIQRKIATTLNTDETLENALEKVLEYVCEIDVISCGSIFVISQETGIAELYATEGWSREDAYITSEFTPDSTFAQALLSGKPSFCIYSEELEQMKKRLKSNISLSSLAYYPVFSDNKIVSIITLGSCSSDQIPLTIRNTLEMITSQIGDAISRMQMEKAFRQSEKRYRSFVQNFGGIAYKIKDDLTPEFYHGAVQEITNYSSEELMEMEKGWKEIIHPYDLTIYDESFQDKLSPEKARGSAEYRIITKDGEIKWVYDIWQNYQQSENNFEGFQGSIHDISELKNAQKELQNIHEDLEQRVEERTQELKEMNDELTAFSYSVSHDLRTPLRHIMGFADLLHKRIDSIKNPDEKIVNYKDKIIESATEMNKLIDGLLTFSRMSRKEMVKITINLNELVQDVLSGFQMELQNREVDISVNYLPNVVGDPSLLRLVLVNLLSNAFKFTKTRDIAEIEIGSMPSKFEEKATIYVRDNGVGFDMQYYDRLFGVFQRLHKNEEFEGTGIGLATVQRVLRRQGGTIWAEGEVDKGSTFYFSIPKAKKQVKRSN